MIAGNIRKVKERIENKCSEIERDPAGIKLIAVSKNFGIDAIKKAYDEGIRDFGENRAQELDIKFSRMPEFVSSKSKAGDSDVSGRNIVWHFIGNLQRNKVRFAVDCADYIHSVDSLMLAAEINKRAGAVNKIQKVLLQINTSEEDTKSGLTNYSEIRDLAGYCNEFPSVELIGLMTIGPLTNDMELVRKSFTRLRKLKNRLNGDNFANIKELSMGMTSDFEIAIEEGATMLRVGSAIFGERDYSKDWRESL